MTDQTTDPVEDAKAHMEALKDAAPALKAERSKCEVRIAEIDMLLADMGGIAKPSRGRPRGSKTKAKEVPQPVTTD